jgi:uncharacterized membrane protein YccC
MSEPVDLVWRVVEAIAAAAGGGLATWFATVAFYGRRLDRHARDHALALAAESKRLGDGQVAESARIDRDMAQRLRALREDLTRLIDEVKAELHDVREKGDGFRESSNHDFAKEAAVARDMREITDVCQRLLHTVGVLEGILRQGGVDLGPGLVAPPRPALPRLPPPRPRPR